MNNNTPRTRPASEDVTKNSNQQESPVSVMGLYPVVHDLSEIEYRECCNPFDALSDWFHEDSTSCSSHHYLVEEVATTTPTIPTTPASAPTPSRPKMFELDASSRDLLLTPNLDHDEQGSARDDSFRELPDFLPKPAALEHRRRATSCEVVQSVVAPNQDSSVSSTREEEEEADDDVVPLPPTSFHRRSMSEGAGVVFHQAFQVNSSRNEVGGTPNSGSSSMTFHEKRFRDEYVPIRRVSCSFAIAIYLAAVGFTQDSFVLTEVFSQFFTYLDFRMQRFHRLGLYPPQNGRALLRQKGGE